MVNRYLSSLAGELCLLGAIINAIILPLVVKSWMLGVLIPISYCGLGLASDILNIETSHKARNRK